LKPALLMFCGVWIFFVIERVMKIIGNYRDVSIILRHTILEIDKIHNYSIHHYDMM
jgi:hypothetical protein